MSDNNEPEQPRQPHNLQGLLKFAMEATKDEDPTHASHFEQMDPERKRFLEEALKSLTIDVVEELNKAMKTLIDGNSNEDDQVQALEVVTNFVADIDTANDFFKIGGFCIILPCLNSPYSVVRSETAMLIGELAQNNPFCQKHLLDLQVLPKLIEMLSDETEVAVHSFHAISCLVRSYEPALANFIEIGGLECLLGLISAGKEQEKLIIKSMFLISSFSKDFPPVRDELVKLDAIDRVARTIEPKSQYDTRLEQTLSALDSLIETKDGVKRCRNKVNLKEKLEKIIHLGEGKDECNEQIEYSKRILEKISI